MPFSIRENDVFVKAFVDTHEIRTVLDVGAGSGTYSSILRDKVERIDAVEIWEPYVKQFSLEDKYDEVIVGDIGGVTIDRHYDLVIFGDVIEHLTEAEAVAVWQDAKWYADWRLLSVPIIHYPQGEVGGNPFEAHLQEHLTPERVEEIYGPFWATGVFPVTGTFIAGGDL